ncbi:MAG: hypothetical protein BIFFINMI_03875 [Phycisphaerae bacterium]|nr:hypothetical protein [Phycisphaerae bacterium]
MRWHKSPANALPAAAALILAAALSLLSGCDNAGLLARDKDPFGPLQWVIAPTQGRPALATVGGRLGVQFRVPPDFRGRVDFVLADSFNPDRRYGRVHLSPEKELEILTPPTVVGPGDDKDAPAESPATGTLVIPDYMDSGLYDLVIALYKHGQAEPFRVKLIPRAVGLRIGQPSAFRFVQLSDMNVGSPTAPQFSQELVDEVNRIAPAFIITTGDYTQWSGVRNDAESWRRVKQYFAKFEAPVFLTVGDHDDQASFRQWVAPSLSGRFAFGEYQGVLLFDTYLNPIDQDMAQMLWMDDVLSESRHARMTFLVSPNDTLRVFDAWRKLGHPPEKYVRDRRVGMIFVGGHSDWDGVEQAGKLAGVQVHYVRTHESSTYIGGTATGTPHYRIVEVAGDRVRYTLPVDGPDQRREYSVPVGQLQVAIDGPNDGTRSTLKVTVLNRLTLPVPGLRVKLRLRATLLGKPSVVGGQIERVIDLGGQREVWLRIDCPDRGLAAAVVGEPGDLPKPPADLKFTFLGDPLLTYRPTRSPDGFTYYDTDSQVQLRMENAGKREQQFWPVLRLNGNVLTLKGADPNQPITLSPGEQRVLPVRLPLALAAPGEHWLTLQLGGDPLPFVTRQVLQLQVRDHD